MSYTRTSSAVAEPVLRTVSVKNTGSPGRTAVWSAVFSIVSVVCPGELVELEDELLLREEDDEEELLEELRLELEEELVESDELLELDELRELLEERLEEELLLDEEELRELEEELLEELRLELLLEELLELEEELLLEDELGVMPHHTREFTVAEAKNPAPASTRAWFVIVALHAALGITRKRSVKVRVWLTASVNGWHCTRWEPSTVASAQPAVLPVDWKTSRSFGKMSESCRFGMAVWPVLRTEITYSTGCPRPARPCCVVISMKNELTACACNSCAAATVSAAAELEEEDASNARRPASCVSLKAKKSCALVRNVWNAPSELEEYDENVSSGANANASSLLEAEEGNASCAKNVCSGNVCSGNVWAGSACCGAAGWGMKAGAGCGGAACEPSSSGSSITTGCCEPASGSVCTPPWARTVVRSLAERSSETVTGSESVTTARLSASAVRLSSTCAPASTREASPSTIARRWIAPGLEVRMNREVRSLSMGMNG